MLRFVVPVDPEDDERDQVPQSERDVARNHTNIWSGQERRDHGKLVDALWVRKYLNKIRFLPGLWCSVVEPVLFIDGKFTDALGAHRRKRT